MDSLKYLLLVYASIFLINLTVFIILWRGSACATIATWAAWLAVQNCWFLAYRKHELSQNCRLFD